MAQQVGDPLRVAHIGLAPGHGLDVLRVDHHQLEAPLQQVIDRLPEHAGRLHRHVGAPRRCQPIAECQQLARHRAEGADLLARSTLRSGHKQASDDGSLVDIEAATALVQDLHGVSLLLHETAGVRALLDQILVCVLRAATLRNGSRTGDRRWCLRTRGSDSPAGSWHQTHPDLPAGRLHEQHTRRLGHFHAAVVPRRGHGRLTSPENGDGYEPPASADVASGGADVGIC